jgi:hypothetical protein
LLQEQAVRRVAMQHEAAESIAADLIRALRGRRSRAAFSKRLGYRSNVVYRWETGLAWPPADELLEALARRNPQLNGLFVRFLGRSPSWLDPTAPLGATSVAAFLRELRGKTPIAALSARSGYSRFSIGRWLHGRARPRLPELLCLVEAASRRALDLLALLTDPAHMPTVAPRWRQLCVARETAYEAPWSHAVLRAVELRDYARNPSSARLARRLGLTIEQVETGLDQLARGGQIRWSGKRWRVAQLQLVDTSADPMRARKLKAGWARTAIERLETGSPGSFGYSLFAVSRAELRRLRELQLQYVRAMQTVIAESTEAECVGLYCTQLVDLAVEDNALA